jgi:hypothetical protein
MVMAESNRHGVRPMTATRLNAFTVTILAAAFVTGISGAAIAGENGRNQAQAPTTPNAVTAAPGTTSNNVSTWAAAYAYQVARKCLDNILPECPKK